EGAPGGVEVVEASRRGGQPRRHDAGAGRGGLTRGAVVHDGDGDPAASEGEGDGGASHAGPDDDGGGGRAHLTILSGSSVGVRPPRRAGACAPGDRGPATGPRNATDTAAAAAGHTGPMRMPTELHLHLEGTLEPEMTFRLAEQNRLDLPWRDPDELRARFDFTDLQSFLDLYTMSQEVLRTGEDFHALTDAYLARAAAAGVRHAEVSLDLQAHTGRGVRAAEVLDGVTSALQAAPGRHGLSAGLIVTVLRHLPGEAALATVRE